jgi:hypothetical protein
MLDNIIDDILCMILSQKDIYACKKSVFCYVKVTFSESNFDHAYSINNYIKCQVIDNYFDVTPNF